jgi:hypothetical protein
MENLRTDLLNAIENIAISHDIYSRDEVYSLINRIKDIVKENLSQPEQPKFDYQFNKGEVPMELAVDILRQAEDVHNGLLDDIQGLIEEAVENFDYSEYLEFELDENEITGKLNQRGTKELNNEITEAFDNDEDMSMVKYPLFIRESLIKLGYDARMSYVY